MYSLQVQKLVWTDIHWSFT